MSSWRDRQREARERLAQQYDYGIRSLRPGTQEYAEKARADVLPGSAAELAATSGLPIIGDAGDAALLADAVKRGSAKDAMIYGAGLALPFIGGPLVKKGAEWLGERAVRGLPGLPEDLTREGAEALSAVPADIQQGAIFTTRGKHAPVPRERAEEMVAAGATQKEIWDETGWWIDVPGDPDNIPVIGGKPLREIEDPADLEYREMSEADLARKAQMDEAARMLEESAPQLERIKSSGQPKETQLAMAQEVIKDWPDEKARQAFVASVMHNVPLDHFTKQIRMQAKNQGYLQAPLGSRFEHPDLYAEHPELRGLPTALVDKSDFLGAYIPSGPGGRRMELSKSGIEKRYQDALGGPGALPKRQTSIAIHEAGHGVQHGAADMPTGASPESARGDLTKAYMAGRIDRDQYNKLMQMDAYDIYQRVGGEALSRLAQTRWKGDPRYHAGLAELMNLPAPAPSRYPWEDLDVPWDEVFW